MSPEVEETRKRDASRPEGVASLLIVEGDRARNVALEDEVSFGRAP